VGARPPQRELNGVVDPGNGLDVWCYDALTARVFADGLCALSVLASLDVIETEFDMNPAAHVTYIRATTPIEDYLASPTADERVVRYLREIRIPGATTHLVLDRSAAGWTIDGVAPHAIPCEVGDINAGFIDESPRTERPYRAVVVPGTHVVRVYRNGGLTDQTISIAQGTRLVVE
jgi:hypothetical protein